MTPGARSTPPRSRSPRTLAVLPILAVACACLARPALAADPVEMEAVPGTHAMEHEPEAGATDADTVDHGAHAGMRADVDASGHGTSSARVRTSAAGLYRVELRDLPDPVPLNRMHEWVVHVESADGTPVTGASIAMAGGMPIHDHGLPTAPRVTGEIADGDYRLEGGRFQMGGHRVVELTIDAAPGEDSVSFDLNL